VQIFEAALMFVMGLNMFGLFEISLPGSLQNRLASIGGLGVRGAFVIGFATGPIAAPCATAGLVGILDYVFRMRDVVGGGVALLFYSLGLGLPFFLVGAFSLGLPKPGVWMDRIKSVFGLVLFVLGLYYLRSLVPVFQHPPHAIPAHPGLYVALVVLGLGVGAIHLSLKSESRLEIGRKVAGIVLASLGAAWLVAYEPPSPTIAWQHDARNAAEQARSHHQPVLIDFGAYWCPDCNKLARETFTHPSVRRESARFIAIKVFPENAEQENEAVLALRESYGVRGLPTLLVFNSQGREVLRLTDFVPPERLVALLRAVD
jgi:thiol:disulfide interchange protein DsbD